MERQIPAVKNYSAKQITKLRVKNQVSQRAFARLLNVSEVTVKRWERGETRPSGIGMKLLNIVSKHGIEILM